MSKWTICLTSCIYSREAAQRWGEERERSTLAEFLEKPRNSGPLNPSTDMQMRSFLFSRPVATLYWLDAPRLHGRQAECRAGEGSLGGSVGLFGWRGLPFKQRRFRRRRRQAREVAQGEGRWRRQSLGKWMTLLRHICSRNDLGIHFTFSWHCLAVICGE